MADDTKYVGGYLRRTNNTIYTSGNYLTNAYVSIPAGNGNVVSAYVPVYSTQTTNSPTLIYSGGTLTNASSLISGNSYLTNTSGVSYDNGYLTNTSGVSYGGSIINTSGVSYGGSIINTSGVSYGNNYLTNTSGVSYGGSIINTSGVSYGGGSIINTSGVSYGGGSIVNVINPTDSASHGLLQSQPWVCQAPSNPDSIDYMKTYLDYHKNEELKSQQWYAEKGMGDVCISPEAEGKYSPAEIELNQDHVKIMKNMIIDTKSVEKYVDPCKSTISKYTKSTVKQEKGKISASKVDKRVTLTCCPKTRAFNVGIFAKKIHYVLGTRRQDAGWMSSYGNFYGLLYNSLSSSAGLIFPYTPKIGFQHSVNYDSTDIMHSNLTFNSYKNTPPPTISLTGKFTADTRENALHMLSAIWFCIACTKCEFGEKAASAGIAGLPPPILYLSAYDNLIDNIPVVISSVQYDYPDDLHYVNLVLDMSMDYTKGEEFCSIYNIDKKVTTETYDIKGSAKPTSVKTTVKGKTYLSFWLPTELTLTLQLKIQPNLLKTRKQWYLDDYKTGLLMTDIGKTTEWGQVDSGLREYRDNCKSTENERMVVKDTYDVNGLGEKVNGRTETYIEKGKVLYTSGRAKSNFIPSGWTW